jgi:hypothetical protein
MPADKNANVPFLPDSFEVPPLEQAREKSLSEILRFLWLVALPSDEPVKWPPIGSAKLFERRVSLRRFALRGQHHAPMRGGKCSGAGVSALTDCTPRRRVINGRHATIQVKSRTKIKPASGKRESELSVNGS